MIVVADSGPLHYLILVGEVDLLRTLYGNIIIPPAVVRELTTSGAPSQVAEWMRHPPDWLRIDVIERDTALISSIDAGETAAISLALAIAADLMLVDDRAARSGLEDITLTSPEQLAYFASRLSEVLLTFHKS